jgi:hypothetical protein
MRNKKPMQDTPLQQEFDCLQASSATFSCGVRLIVAVTLQFLASFFTVFSTVSSPLKLVDINYPPSIPPWQGGKPKAGGCNNQKYLR